jgi:DNA invertase Pin-like site-specific DNA recombinase
MNNKARAAIYVRVSTSEQSTDAQEAELKHYAQHRGWTVHKVYRDKGQSGMKTKRPGLDELMADCKRRKFDVVLVWKFDRFARSLKQLIDALQEFIERGIDFVSATEQIDTTTASGKCFFQIIGAIAEFER